MTDKKKLNEEKINEKFEEISHKFQMRFNLPPGRPTRDELKKILNEILKTDKKRSENEIREIVLKHVKFAGLFKREGLDTSDLNDIINQLRQLLKD